VKLDHGSQSLACPAPANQRLRAFEEGEAGADAAELGVEDRFHRVRGLVEDAPAPRASDAAGSADLFQVTGRHTGATLAHFETFGDLIEAQRVLADQEQGEDPTDIADIGGG
jgi:hypothetical protein